MKVAVIGAGLMGHGLALVFAEGGHDVTITDTYPETLNSVKSRIADTLKSLNRDAAAVTHVNTVPTLAAAVTEAEFVIEAAPEKLELKQQLFEHIESSARSDAILATNTSVIPIAQIMRRVKSKHRAIGTHWWNPPYLVPLVEVIQTADTASDVVVFTMALMRHLGKVPVHVKKDVPGFIGNRLQHALWREAISLIENGVCDAETVDLVVKNSFGRRLAVLGPLENADLVGTDLTLDIHNQVLADLEDSHMASPYLKALVGEGKLGFKTNTGFRNWDEDKKSALRTKVTNHLKLLNQILELS